MGDDQKQELKRDLKHFWHKCTQIPKFKYWKWIILIICISGLYSFYLNDIIKISWNEFS